MPFCPSCGTKLSASTKFCPNCGTKIQSADTKAVVPTSKSSAGAKSHLPVMDEHMFSDLMNVLTRGHMDAKSQRKRLKPTLNNYQWTCAQAAAVAKVTQGWYDRLGTYSTVLIYPNIVDRENFESILEFYTFQEEKDEIREMVAKYN